MNDQWIIWVFLERQPAVKNMKIFFYFYCFLLKTCELWLSVFSMRPGQYSEAINFELFRTGADCSTSLTHHATLIVLKIFLQQIITSTGHHHFVHHEKKNSWVQEVFGGGVVNWNCLSHTKQSAIEMLNRKWLIHTWKVKNTVFFILTLWKSRHLLPISFLPEPNR